MLRKLKTNSQSITYIYTNRELQTVVQFMLFKTLGKCSEIMDCGT